MSHVTAARSGKGTKLYIGDGASTETFAQVLDLVSVGSLQLTRNFLPATHLDSPDQTEEFIPDFLSPGSLPLVVQWRPDADTGAQRQLETDLASGVLRNFYVDWAGVRRDDFTAYVESCGKAAAVGEVMRMEVSLKLTGAPDIDVTT